LSGDPGDKSGGADGGRQGLGVVGVFVDVDCRVGELDGVLVAV
jgi:hypothetical protein